MINNIFNLISKFMPNAFLKEEVLNQNSNNHSMQNLSDYPDVVYTNKTSCQNCNKPQDNISQGFMPFANSDLLKNFLPMIFGGKKNQNFNVMDLFKEVPQISNILSLIKPNSKKENEKDNNSSETIIDVSDYTEIT